MKRQLNHDGESSTPQEELSYGEKILRIRFNPNNQEIIHRAKEVFARQINQMKEIQDGAITTEERRLTAIAMTKLEEAQMWVVKALTLEGLIP